MADVFVLIGVFNARRDKKDAQHLAESRDSRRREVLASPTANALVKLIESYGTINESEDTVAAMTEAVRRFAGQAVEILWGYESETESPHGRELLLDAIDELRSLRVLRVDEYAREVARNEVRGESVAVSVAFALSQVVAPELLHLMLREERMRSRFSLGLLQSVDPDFYRGLVETRRRQKGMTTSELDVSRLVFVEQILIRETGVSPS